MYGNVIKYFILYVFKLGEVIVRLQFSEFFTPSEFCKSSELILYVIRKLKYTVDSDDICHALQ